VHELYLNAATRFYQATRNYINRGEQWQSVQSGLQCWPITPQAENLD